MKQAIAAALLMSVGIAFAGPFDKAWIQGTTDKDPLTYRAGEEMVFTLKVMDVESEIPAGAYFLSWKRTDDFGGFETGRVALSSAPFVYRAKLDQPGFVRLEAHVLDKDGKRLRPFFDGGAGADTAKLESDPEPKDFDEFWTRQFGRLARVPIRADRVALPCANPDVNLYAVRVDCAGLRPVTGYLSVPKDVADGKTYPARLTTHGYNGDGCSHNGPRTSPGDMIYFEINAHGLKLPAFGATEADRKALRWEIRSHDCTYAFDAKQNADPEVAYFNGMVLRVKRALQYLKTVEGWNRQRLDAVGESQGGLQTIWAAGCGEGVTRAYSSVAWCCDMPKNNMRLARKISSDGWYIPWTESMGYYDAANFAKRIPLSCRTIITRAGLGDYCCPPMGLAKLYNNIPGNKEVRWMQGSRHGYLPPLYEGREFIHTDKIDAALLLTFDDRNFPGWRAAVPLFAKYGAQATFYVCGPIDETAVREMKFLAQNGHSLGLHGLRHVNADAAVDAKGAEGYYRDEILPQYASCRSNGVYVGSFAYPNCRRNDKSDALFREKYWARHVRGGVKGATPYDPKGEKQKDRKPLLTNDEVFIPATDAVTRYRLNTILMGEHYHTDIDEILACLRRTKERGEVLTITSHNIAPDAKGIGMKTEWLEKILARARELNLRVVGIDDL